MKHNLTHFAIFTEDQERAQAFYNKVFSWDFNSYGAPGFSQVNNDGQLIGAMQDRKYQMTSEKVIGFECTIQVTDIDEITKLVTEAGGEILLPKAEIPGVGWLIKFKDTEGNVVCAMQYLSR